jgi:hypothetical protein
MKNEKGSPEPPQRQQWTGWTEKNKGLSLREIGHYKTSVSTTRLTADAA